MIVSCRSTLKSLAGYFCFQLLRIWSFVFAFCSLLAESNRSYSARSFHCFFWSCATTASVAREPRAITAITRFNENCTSCLLGSGSTPTLPAVSAATGSPERPPKSLANGEYSRSAICLASRPRPTVRSPADPPVPHGSNIPGNLETVSRLQVPAQLSSIYEIRKSTETFANVC